MSRRPHALGFPRSAAPRLQRRPDWLHVVALAAVVVSTCVTMAVAALFGPDLIDAAITYASPQAAQLLVAKP